MMPRSPPPQPSHDPEYVPDDNEQALSQYSEWGFTDQESTEIKGASGEDAGQGVDPLPLVGLPAIKEHAFPHKGNSTGQTVEQAANAGDTLSENFSLMDFVKRVSATSPQNRNNVTPE